ncbi:MAG: ROK family protein, partial [Mycobacterium sp.]|nr:ROK family protein [Mycobacterium sp.]
MTVLAMEIGPKRFAVAEVVPADEPFGEMREIPVPAKKAWAECREMVLDVAAGRPVTSVGIASSGPLDMSAGVVAPPEIPDWRAGFPLVDSLRELFPDAKV